MLRIADEFESTPLNSGLKERPVGLWYVSVDDNVGSSMRIIGSTLNVDVRGWVNLDGGLKLIWLDWLIVAFKEPVKHDYLSFCSKILKLKKL